MLRLLCLVSLVSLAAGAFAESAQEYCNSLYPADSYDAEDRSVYIQECLEMYSEEFAVDEPAATPEPAMDSGSMVEESHDQEYY